MTSLTLLVKKIELKFRVDLVCGFLEKMTLRTPCDFDAIMIEVECGNGRQGRVAEIGTRANQRGVDCSLKVRSSPTTAPVMRLIFISLSLSAHSSMRAVSMTWEPR